ncbi:MAG: adenylate/guanylate cyclase domain-containing protein [Alphaproteobacteria bacterium]
MALTVSNRLVASAVGRLVQAAWTFVTGPPVPMALPARVRETIRREQAQGEIVVGCVQVAAIVTFGALYAVAPKAFPPDVPFEPVPWALGFYAVFVAARLWLAWRGELSRFFLIASVMMDMAVLMLTIWSFHIQYQQEPAFYLKAPTLLYVFIIIVLRALRFEAGYVLLAGATAALGWFVLLGYAVASEPNPMAAVTHDYVAYMTSSRILLGAEFDKIASILMVTAILAVVIVRARKMLVRAVTEQTSAGELSRFFAPEVARRIRATDHGIRPGDAELRQAAAMFIDLRGFTPLAETLAPGELMALLGDYQGRVVPAIKAHDGSIDKFLGDGILASFGAARASETYAADALRAAEAVGAEAHRWAEARRASGLPAPAVGIGIATGAVIFGAIGDESRLEYTVLGDTVNTAAKLEKHTKAEGVGALTTLAAYELAIAQGYRPQAPHETRAKRRVAGLPEAADLVVLAP